MEEEVKLPPLKVLQSWGKQEEKVLVSCDSPDWLAALLVHLLGKSS